MALSNATQLIINTVGIWVLGYETAKPKQNIYTQSLISHSLFIVWYLMVSQTFVL